MKILLTKKTLFYVASNLCAKGLAGFTQLYAIFVFTKMQTQDEAALIFLLFGYAIWFQIFEFGLAQSLQNKFNSRMISSRDVLKTIIVHYIFLLFVAAFIVFTPYFSGALLPKHKIASSDDAVIAFSIGAAMLAVSSSNVLLQRFLLVINKGFLGNMLLLCQSIITILGLGIYNFYGYPNLVIAVSIYLGPQILIMVPLLVQFTFRLKDRPIHKSNIRLGEIFYDSLGFCGIGILSAVFLGSDYYFAAHYLDSSEVISYYLVTRIYFISFVVYYAYLLHRVKRLSKFTFGNNKLGALSAIKDSILVGSFSVLVVYLLAVFLELKDLLGGMTNGIGVQQILLFLGFMYFLARVCRDVVVVVASALNEKNLLYKIYFIEILAALILMYFLVPTYGGIGIFASMMAACFFGFLYFFWYLKKTKLLISGD